MDYAYSSNGGQYIINSERAYDFINNASIGTKMTGGDGSIWTRMIDGRTRIDKNGETYYYGSTAGNSSSEVFGNSDLNGAIDQLIKVSNSNSARSAEEAANLRRWQEHQNSIAMGFNAQQAALNRDWQEFMSNTAHQREVADLKAAGLNPVLSASGGNGAAVTSGATASGLSSSGAKGEVDMSADAAIVNLLGTMLNMQNNMAMSTLSAQTNLAVADKYNAASELVAQISGMYGLKSAQESASASRYHSDIEYQKNIENISAAFGRDYAKYEHEKYMAEHYPDSLVSFVNLLSGALFGSDSLTGANQDYQSSSKIGTTAKDAMNLEQWLHWLLTGEDNRPWKNKPSE